jgi:hypothetical protein
MNTHEYFADLLPLYAAGQLNGPERTDLERHLATCLDCRTELEAWMAVGEGIYSTSSTVQAPTGLAERALERIHAPTSFQRALHRTFNLLRTQAYLVRREMWPSTAILMFMGVAATLLSRQVILIRYLAPLVAAASLTVLFGPDNDPACELTLTTPTAPWKILLARLALVHGYNLVLTLIASLLLLLIIPAKVLWIFILGWLGPMTFLPALALLLSLWTGSGNSVAIAYGLWLLQFISPTWLPERIANMLMPAMEAYRQFWGQPLPLMAAGLVLLAAALWSAERAKPWLIRSPV